MSMSPRLLRPRASGAAFDPRSISGLTMWLDAQTSSSLVESSGQVSQWTDLSGSGNHATQTTANNRPTLFTSSSDVQTATAATINGRQALYFDGVNDQLELVTSLIRNLPGHTILTVCEFESNSGTPGLLYHQGGNQRQALFVNFSAISISSRRVSSDTLNTLGTGVAAQVNSPTLIDTSTNYQTAAARLSVNGSLSINSSFTWGTGNSADDALDVRLIGRFSNAGYLKGKIGAMLFYNRVLSDDENAAVRSWLAGRWGIALA